MDPINLATQFPFTAFGLTRAINQVPMLWGRIGSLGIFGASEYLATTAVQVDITKETLTLLQSKERGSPADWSKSEPDETKYFKIPYFPLDDVLRPVDVQDRRAPGTDQLDTVTRATNKKLRQMNNKHAITLEYLRMSALKGKVVDPNTGKTIHDYYSSFGVTQEVVDLKLGTNTSDIRKLCRQILNFMEANLDGDVMSGARVMLATDLFDKFVAHPNVDKYFVNWQASGLAQNDDRHNFPFGGLIWDSYQAAASKKDGTAQPFIDAGAGHAFPTGTMDTFQQFYAPPDSFAGVNMPADTEVFVSPKLLDHGKGIELHSESSPLPFVRRPKLLVKVYSSN